MADAISVQEARRRVLEASPGRETEVVPLARALDRVLAEQVLSVADLPPFDSSAMDGYAVPADAVGGDPPRPGVMRASLPRRELAVVGEARAGAPADVAVEPGTAVRISTGAEIPAGAAAVVPVERTAEAGPGRVSVQTPWAGANIRPRGEVLRKGRLALGGGVTITPGALGVLAAAGRSEVTCARRPLVAILATGDELVEPGVRRRPGEIWSSNPLALAGQVDHAGGIVERSETVPDDEASTQAAIGAAVEAADVVCVSGGVSVGPHDHVKAAFAAVGVEESFWRVALRPGRPTWFGVAPGSGTLAFGLPGNPVSAMVCFQLFVLHALRAMQGADPFGTRGIARLDETIARRANRADAVRCRLRATHDGLRATPTGSQDSHAITSMPAADCLALIPAGDGVVAAGDQVDIEHLRTRP